MKAWNGLDNFRGDSQVSTWLYRIATNETLTFLAAKRMKNINSLDEVEDVLLQNLKADSYFNGDETQLQLQKAILAREFPRAPGEADVDELPNRPVLLG